MRTKWYKASWVCTNCDSLTEQTSYEHTFADWSPTCNCIESNEFQIMLSVDDATIEETTTEKEVAPMDQKTDTVYATEEFLRDALAKSALRVGELEAHIQNITQRDYATAGALSGMRDAMQDWTLAEFQSQGINQEQAEQIAEICGFELSKEFEVEVTVTFSATVKAVDEEEAQSAIYDIDFDTVEYNTDFVTYMSSSVDSINI